MGGEGWHPCVFHHETCSFTEGLGYPGFYHRFPATEEILTLNSTEQREGTEATSWPLACALDLGGVAWGATFVLASQEEEGSAGQGCDAVCAPPHGVATHSHHPQPGRGGARGTHSHGGLAVDFQQR